MADRLPVRLLRPTAFIIVALGALALPLTTTSAPAWFALLAAIGGLSGSLYTLSVYQAGHAGAPVAAMGVVAGISLAYTLGSTLGAPLAGTALNVNIGACRSCFARSLPRVW